MTRRELQSFMTSQGCMPFYDVCTDENYVHPDRAWFFGPFARAVMNNVRNLGLDKWHKDANDCDKFSRRVSQWARDAWALTNPDSESGIAVADFLYTPDGSKTGHAIVCAVVYISGLPKLLFMEPQSGQEITLSPQEKRLCLGYWF